MKGELTFMDKLQEILGKVSIKLSGNLYINAIKDGMLAYMPFAFIASIFLIIAFFPIPAFTDFVSSITGLEAAVWQGKLALVNDASLGFRVIIVIEANSYVNIRSSRLLPKFKIQKINSWCAA